MARRGTPLAKKVVCRSAFWTAHRFDERRPCACTSLPGENYSAGGLTGCLTYIKRIKDTVIRQDLSRKIIQSYRGWIAIKRRFYIYYTTDCAIELSIIRYKIRWPLPVRSADSNKRKETVSPDLSVRQLDRAILSLPAQMFSNSISTYPLAIRLLVISTPFPTSLPGFIPSFRNCPPLSHPSKDKFEKFCSFNRPLPRKGGQFVRSRVGSISTQLFTARVVRHATAERASKFSI